MPPKNTSFISLAKLATCLDTNTDELLFEARQGKLKLCAETRNVNARPSGILRTLRNEKAMGYGIQLPDWLKGSYFIWVQPADITEIVTRGCAEIKNAQYPYRTGGSAHLGRVVYREDTVTFQEMCKLYKESLLVLDGDAAQYYEKTKNLSTIPVSASDSRALRLNRYGKSEGGVYKLYSFHEIFRKEVLGLAPLKKSAEKLGTQGRREKVLSSWLEKIGWKGEDIQDSQKNTWSNLRIHGKTHSEGNPLTLFPKTSSKSTIRSFFYIRNKGKKSVDVLRITGQK